MKFTYKQLFMIVLLVLTITGCGGGGGGGGSSSSNDENNNPPQEGQSTSKKVSGLAIDGYISGAKVCLDTNKNNLCDNNEISTTTSSDGSYSLNANTTGTYPIIILGGVDTATGNNFEGILKDIIEVDENSGAINKNITPLTTIAAQNYERQILSNSSYSISKAKEDLANNLGLSKAQISSDALKDKTVFQKTQQIMQTTKLLQKAIQSDDSDKEKNKNAFIHVMEQISISIQNDTNATDLNVSKIITQMQTSSYDGSSVNIDSNVEDFIVDYDKKLVSIITTSTDSNNLDKLQRGIESQTDKGVKNIKDNNTSALNTTLDDIKTNPDDILKAGNDAPSISGAPITSIKENEQYYFKVNASDGNNDSLVFKISNKPSWASFDTKDGVLQGKTSFNDAGSYNDINISVSDGIDEVSLASFSINVININRAPSSEFTSLVVMEDSNYTGVITASDLDNDTLTFSKETEPANATLNIDSNGSFSYSPKANYTGDDSFKYKISDGTDFIIKTVSVKITEFNDAPIINLASSFTLEENVFNFDINASDDSPSLSYSISGPDANYFRTPYSSGIVPFKSSTDFESKSVYNITVHVSDGFHNVSKDITININDTNERPVINNTVTTINVNENQTAVLSLDVTKDAGETLTYSLLYDDYEKFNISSSGVITFKNAPDYESGKTSYSFYAKAHDGTHYAIKSFNINILNVNDKPLMTSANNININENESHAPILTLSAIDEENDNVTFSINSDTFEISGDKLYFKDKYFNPNYETNASYSLNINLSDGKDTSIQELKININDLNDRPDINSSTEVFVNENQLKAYTIVGFDEDKNDTLRYSINSYDSDYFDVNTSSGQVSFKTLPDYETKSTYKFFAWVRDDTTSRNKTITVNLINTNDTPKITSNKIISVNENQTAVATIAANDQDGDTLSFSISGADASSFSMIANSGLLSFKSAPDYENKSSYSLDISVSDGNLSSSEEFTINILDTNDAPINTSNENVNADENQLNAFTISATDQDNDTLSFSILGSDADSFDVNSSTGQVVFKEKPDFEVKTSYSLRTAVSDASESSYKDVNITINNIGDIKIISAIYDNNNSTEVNDDKIYIYFDQPIKTSTIANEIASNYNIIGDGAIGSSSTAIYDSEFNRHIISMDNNGTLSSILKAGQTKISLANNVIEDINGAYITDTNEEIIERLTPVIEDIGRVTETTNSNTIIVNRFIDNSDGTVSYKSHDLMWQKQSDIDTKYTWSEAQSYCSNLSLAGHEDWRVPSIHELVQIVDRGNTSKQELDSAFSDINTNKPLLWSNDSFAGDNTKAWFFDFKASVQDYVIEKTSAYVVMCVRYAK